MNEKIADLNGIALAYMGDAAYEVFVRAHLLNSGLTKPNKLHHRATHFVSAKAQAWLIEEMQAADQLTEEELQFFKRGRNAKSHTTAKNTDVMTYRISTGFEAVFGYLYLSGQNERLQELAEWCIEQVERKQHETKTK
ncbi:MAG: Mini-ribonuclease 3 [Liquorilactobacillus ghanensis]|jgi:ribonuclease-3 family protein|uniref:Mini-ribonuclease 3 n=1 Tax=Liquorilactobacillus ghanensis DSM 18630 TaxID=1423750 RepID=A0A0R1VLB2_9LACO|nr:Mini-ribonuclease 3 [Liquorilactobacillus ghanensis]KRM06616.1 hypothetical protein FC89_GL000770 [Liquorilactobacillus ghanensis DSM 18630]